MTQTNCKQYVDKRIDELYTDLLCYSVSKPVSHCCIKGSKGDTGTSANTFSTYAYSQTNQTVPAGGGWQQVVFEQPTVTTPGSSVIKLPNNVQFTSVVTGYYLVSYRVNFTNLAQGQTQTENFVGLQLTIGNTQLPGASNFTATTTTNETDGNAQDTLSITHTFTIRYDVANAPISLWVANISNISATGTIGIDPDLLGRFAQLFGQPVPQTTASIDFVYLGSL